jgi:hypothetical protein
MNIREDVADVNSAPGSVRKLTAPARERYRRLRFAGQLP